MFLWVVYSVHTLFEGAAVYLMKYSNSTNKNLILLYTGSLDQTMKYVKNIFYLVHVILNSIYL